ncbi:hypothetical protein CTI12_AA203010 [Artemisia annua]|uniref:SWIM-type domain-containing protein n=1 Tax=Artemisia annua TaxID=35608 RepID=A0A2U1P1U3_ARTAN|nr:hypothetical protein CTI12_AA203010 [Artemisia annua]
MCDSITNNISEAFNSWGWYQFFFRLFCLLNLGEYAFCASNNNRAEVKYKGKRWEVILDERKCTCRFWQVRGLPCVHATTFIAFTRDNYWEKYADIYFTVEKFKEAYALEIGPRPTKDQWVHIETEKKIHPHPPIIKRPVGQPRKNRIEPHDESKRRHKCPRCCEYGHHSRTSKNPPLEPSTTKRGQRKNGAQSKIKVEAFHDRN